MIDEEIGNAMRQLPRATVSPRFPSDVLRAARGERRSHGAWRLAAVAAMVLMFLAGMYAASMRDDRQRRLESLRAERQRIEWELQRVKAMAYQSQPVVVLENGDTRLIVNREDPLQQPQLFYY